jgi:hypothetical protein
MARVFTVKEMDVHTRTCPAAPRRPPRQRAGWELRLQPNLMEKWESGAMRPRAVRPGPPLLLMRNRTSPVRRPTAPPLPPAGDGGGRPEPPRSAADGRVTPAVWGAAQ